MIKTLILQVISAISLIKEANILRAVFLARGLSYKAAFTTC
jgi:hypothetical protein